MFEYSNFVSLHNHTDHSILDGYATVGEYIKKAKEYGMKGIGITDNGTASGLYDHIMSCKKENITPIVGVEFYMAPLSNVEYSQEPVRYDSNNNANIIDGDGGYTYLTVIAKNNIGLINLFKLVDKSFDVDKAYQHKKHGKPRISYKLLEEYKDGLIILSGRDKSELNIRLLLDQKKEAVAYLKQMQKTYGEDFYIEVSNHGRKFDKELIYKQMKICEKFNIKPVYTLESHYIDKESKNIQEQVLALGRGFKMNETKITQGGTRYVFDGDRYFYSLKEIEDLWEEIGYTDKTFLYTAMNNTNEVYEKAKNVTLNFNPHLRPRIEVPDNMTEIEYLTQLVEEGYQKKRVNKNCSEEVLKESRERIKNELKVIESNDFVSYFLVVSDYINWAINNGVGVGPGRGCFLPNNKVTLKDNVIKNIQDVIISDRVLTHDNTYKMVEKLWEYKVENERCIELTLSNGEKISGTYDHKIYKKDFGFIPLEDIKENDILQGSQYESTYEYKSKENVSGIFISERMNKQFVYNNHLELTYLNYLETSSNIKEFNIERNEYGEVYFHTLSSWDTRRKVYIKTDRYRQYVLTPEYLQKEIKCKHTDIRVVSKREFLYTGSVYDLKVMDVLNYTVGGVTVHNSVGGSEVAYLLNISNVDPIKFELMFDRFISPGRGAVYRVTYDDGTTEDLNVAEEKIVNGKTKYIYQLNVGDEVE